MWPGHLRLVQPVSALSKRPLVLQQSAFKRIHALFYVIYIWNYLKFSSKTHLDVVIYCIHRLLNQHLKTSCHVWTSLHLCFFLFFVFFKIPLQELSHPIQYKQDNSFACYTVDKCGLCVSGCAFVCSLTWGLSNSTLPAASTHRPRHQQDCTHNQWTSTLH